MTSVSPVAILGVAAIVGIGVGAVTANIEDRSAKGSTERQVFALCHTGGGTNCVVDGDTVWLDGVKIRIADIDAPETHPPRCQREAALGNRATLRLQQLLNDGAFSVEAADRDEDRYGRKLRIITRRGQSLGAMLVSEGLARSWSGARRLWC
ncbi:thermonuclease family protein [Sphingobium sp. B12D2B]|uniref:thermonuclease family protein n=1 Tax=Sphingobium sp. B12D2B TaxID=2940577 RepID=UPI0022247C40|nr:thermonuclease family protein [Sphingobium sp. B12D2B]MCW2351816.1 endonuclease YncB(thermonuclease family) [Sphingobium sp. B12D2B]